jgi:hypothetical protein
LVVCLYLLKKFVAELLSTSYTFRTRSSNMQVHRLIALLARLRLHETRTAAFDLDFAAGLLLDELDVVATTADYLCSKVKATDGLKTYRDLLFGPFTLDGISIVDRS